MGCLGLARTPNHIPYTRMKSCRSCFLLISGGQHSYKEVVVRVRVVNGSLKKRRGCLLPTMRPSNSPSQSRDRRNRARYELELPLHYRLHSGRTGQGTSIDISGQGLAFRSDQPLPEGELIEIEIGWPILARGRDPV